MVSYGMYFMDTQLMISEYRNSTRGRLYKIVRSQQNAHGLPTSVIIHGDKNVYNIVYLMKKLRRAGTNTLEN